MLNLYISHAPADRKYVEQFMHWVQPMQARYHFRIWFDHPEPDPIVPYPWNVIFFWYAPRTRKRPYNRNMHQELEQGHIFLFFTSERSIKTSWIEHLEVPRAVERYQALGSRYVRIYPVQVDKSQWKLHSRLAAFKTLGPGAPLSMVKPSEDGWTALMEDLRKVVVELRQNHIDQHKQLALPTESFHQPPAAWVDTPEVVLPLNNWLGWAVVIVLALGVGGWLVNQLYKPSHKEYWPKKELPKAQTPPPVLTPIPTKPRFDTLTPTGGRIRDPK
jgi:hypothetical protein